MIISGVVEKILKKGSDDLDYSQFAIPKPSYKSNKNKKSKYTEYRKDYCHICGVYKMTSGHHLIGGHGKRIECETEESVIRICDKCHKFLHSSQGQKMNHKLKLRLQEKYFKQGKTEDEVRKLMGGKLLDRKG